MADLADSFFSWISLFRRLDSQTILGILLLFYILLNIFLSCLIMRPLKGCTDRNTQGSDSPFVDSDDEDSSSEDASPEEHDENNINPQQESDSHVCILWQDFSENNGDSHQGRKMRTSQQQVEDNASSVEVEAVIENEEQDTILILEIADIENENNTGQPEENENIMGPVWVLEIEETPL